MLPKELDKEGTKAQGYDVWVPFNRGRCGRVRTEQARCPVGEPGEKSAVEPHYIDATIPWSQGGQRNGIPAPGWRDPRRTSTRTVAPPRTADVHPSSAEDTEHPAVYDDHPVLHILPTDAKKAAEILLAEIADRKGRSLGPSTPEDTHEAAEGALLDAARGAGFTVRHHIADSPKTGFMGSYAGSEDAIPDTVSDHELGSRIDSLMTQHKSHIDSDPSNYFGAWHEDGKIYLDRSRNFADQDKAVKFGYQNHQLALWHLDKGQKIGLYHSGHDGSAHPQAQQNVAQGKYAVLDHPAGHQVINPYGVASTPKDIFTVTAEDEAEERKLRAKYQGGTYSRGGDTQSVITHLRSQQMDHEEFGDL